MIINDVKNAEFGDLMFFEPTSTYSTLQTHIDSIGQEYRNISHTALFYKNEDGIPLMIEAQAKGGVKISVIKDWRNYSIVRIDKSNLKPLGVILEKVGGTQYDFNLIWALFKNRVFGIEIYPNDDKKIVCSKLLNWAYGYTLDDRGNCTPVTLANKYLIKQ